MNNEERNDSSVVSIMFEMTKCIFLIQREKRGHKTLMKFYFPYDLHFGDLNHQLEEPTSVPWHSAIM